MTELLTGCSCSDGTCSDCARDMIAAILAVRDLHRPIQRTPGALMVCKGCTEAGRIGMAAPTARMAGVAYPCATIRVLDAKGAPLERETAA